MDKGHFSARHGNVFHMIGPKKKTPPPFGLQVGRKPPTLDGPGPRKVPQCPKAWELSSIGLRENEPSDPPCILGKNM